MNEAAKAGRRTRKAIAKVEQRIADAERLFGPADRMTLWARTACAGAYHEAGRTGEAMAMLEQIAADAERILGPDHQDTLDARMTLALGYREKGDTAGAMHLADGPIVEDRPRFPQVGLDVGGAARGAGIEQRPGVREDQRVVIHIYDP